MDAARRLFQGVRRCAVKFTESAAFFKAAARSVAKLPGDIQGYLGIRNGAKAPFRVTDQHGWAVSAPMRIRMSAVAAKQFRCRTVGHRRAPPTSSEIAFLHARIACHTWVLMFSIIPHRHVDLFDMRRPCVHSSRARSGRSAISGADPGDALRHASRLHIPVPVAYR